MSPEAQRIAITEACGLKPRVICEHWKHPGRSATIEGCPACPPHLKTCCLRILCDHPSEGASCKDYLNDLNAMHEAEKVLTEEQLKDYADWLLVISNSVSSLHASWFNATARQRAEAFLRTLGLWDDGCPKPRI